MLFLGAMVVFHAQVDLLVHISQAAAMKLSTKRLKNFRFISKNGMFCVKDVIEYECSDHLSD